MGTRKQLLNSFEIRVLDESYSRIDKCLDLLTESQVWHLPQENIPSVGSLVLHLCGNARQWILSGLAGQEDNRIREEEFSPIEYPTKKELKKHLLVLESDLRNYFIIMEEEILAKPFIIQGFNVDGYEAIIHVLEHFSYHTGQITTITKLLTNKETNYYEDLDLDITNE